MEKYLQYLVITLPAVVTGMGGILLIVFMCLRSWSKISANRLVPQRCVTTQVDGSLQMNYDIRNKLVEEAMTGVKFILAEEFRKRRATKISQEEFNNLYKKQQGLDSGSSTYDGADEKRRRPEMESECRIPGLASRTSAPTTQDSASGRKTDSFSALWVEELQRSKDVNDFVPGTRTEINLPEKEPPVQDLPTPPQHSLLTSSNSSGTGQLESLSVPPQHSLVTPSDSSSTGQLQESSPKPPQYSIVTSSESSGTGQLEYEGQDCTMTKIGLGDASDLKEVKSPNELSLIHDLEMFLLLASSSLCRSIMALTAAHKSGKEIILRSNEEICMIPDHERLELGPNTLASVASTSTIMNVPQCLKGGAPQHQADSFEWRLDIEDKDVEASPPNTPVRHRPPTHLCRGVQFRFEEHLPALSLIDLDPEQGYGWRGPDWKETLGKYNVYKDRQGSSIYRKQKLPLASDASVMEYYKLQKVEAKTRWETIKGRYRKARELAQWRGEVDMDIHESAEWRGHLRMMYQSDSSSASSDLEPQQRRAQHPSETGRSETQQGEETQEGDSDYEDPDRVRSMLSSSSTSLDSDDSCYPKNPIPEPKCNRKHVHCFVDVEESLERPQ